MKLFLVSEINLKTFFKILLVFTFSLFVFAKSQLKDLNETSWVEVLEGEWFILFYAPWCPACKQIAPVWKEFSEWGEDLSIEVGQIDVTTNPGLTGRFMITALPTVYHVKNGEFRLYSGARDKDALFNFIEEKKWSKIDPVSSWGSPQSLSMSTVAYFFKLSMKLRDMHNYLTEKGFHVWTAHSIFGVVTILTGILLGLLIVAIIDCMYSTRRWFSSSSLEKDNQDNSENNDLLQPPEEGIEDLNTEDERKDDDSSGERRASFGAGDINARKDRGNRSSDSEDDQESKNVHSSNENLSPEGLVHRKVTSSNMDTK